MLAFADMSETRGESSPNDRLVAVVRDVLAPMVAVDGGSIELIDVRDGIAEIALGGACAGCPGQAFTSREVVLPALQTVDPGIVAVKVSVAL